MNRRPILRLFRIASATGGLALASSAHGQGVGTAAAASIASPLETPPPDPSAAPASTESSPGAGEFEQLIDYGSRLAVRGDYDGAEIALRQVLDAPAAKVSDVKSALLALAHMYRRQQSLTKAAAVYERYLRDYHGDERIPEALLDLGRTLRSLGAHKLALARFYSVINSTLKLPSGSLERYQALTKTAQFEIAETYFESGDFIEAGKFYVRLGLLDLAKEDRARVQFKAAFAQKLHGDLAGAVVTLRSFLGQWPQDEHAPEARYLLATALRELNRPQEAYAATLQLLQAEQSKSGADPKRRAYWQQRTGNQLANAFFEAGDVLNAQTIYTNILELSTEPAWRLPTTYQLGLCYERTGQPERARSAYQLILDSARTSQGAGLDELVRMATWRLEHLAWRDAATLQVSTLVEHHTGKQVAAAGTLPAKTAATP